MSSTLIMVSGISNNLLLREGLKGAFYFFLFFGGLPLPSSLPSSLKLPPSPRLRWTRRRTSVARSWSFGDWELEAMQYLFYFFLFFYLHFDRLDSVGNRFVIREEICQRRLRAKPQKSQRYTGMRWYGAAPMYRGRLRARNSILSGQGVSV